MKEFSRKNFFFKLFFHCFTLSQKFLKYIPRVKCEVTSSAILNSQDFYYKYELHYIINMKKYSVKIYSILYIIYTFFWPAEYFGIFKIDPPS